MSGLDSSNATTGGFDAGACWCSRSTRSALGHHCWFVVPAPEVWLNGHFDALLGSVMGAENYGLPSAAQTRTPRRTEALVLRSATGFQRLLASAFSMRSKLYESGP